MSLCQAGSNSEIPVYSRLPISIVRGDGCRVWDESGKEYIDLYGGHAVAALGYNHPDLTQAIQRQAAELLFQTNAVELPVRSRAIEKLAQLLPKPLEKVFLVNSGAEANENALRLAFLATGRKRIARLQHSFHGRTAAAGAVTEGHEKWYGFPQSPFEVDVIEAFGLASLDEALTNDTAAFLFEPLQGVAGAIEVPKSFIQQAQNLCRERGILLIADEVQTGIGRTGTFLAIEQVPGFEVDIVTLGKALAGGLPAAAVACSAKVASTVKVGMLGTTFGGGPLACAAMECVLETVSQPDFLTQVRQNSSLLAEASLVPGVQRISGAGFMLGLHLDRPAAPIRSELLQRGFLSGDAKDPNVIRLLPPLILSAEEIGLFGAALQEVLS